MLLLTPELIIHKCEEDQEIPFPFARTPTQHAHHTLHLPPFLPVHIRLFELKGITNRPRCTELPNMQCNAIPENAK